MAFVYAVVGLSVVAVFLALLVPLAVRLLGSGRFVPEDMAGGLSPAARTMLDAALGDLTPGEARDYHAHMIGLGTGGSGASVNPRMLSWRHPFHRVQALVYLSAAGITDESRADEQYVDRLLRLIRAAPGHGKTGLLAFDWFHRADGTADPEKSPFHTPNDRVLDLAAAHPDAFFPMVSVHPYRADAVAELHRCADRGARYVKWLPNAQGMDASDPRTDAYYDALVERSMVLLTHVGEEKAVEAGEDQALGNPLLFRRPLDRGVTVIMAHAASLGGNADLDNPGRRAANFELFMRLFGDPRYAGRLFADISAITQFNRIPGPVVELLARPDLHHRLVNGTDYPLAAMNVMVHLRPLIRAGLLAPADGPPLREIFRYNPLVFDLALKRRLRHPASGTRFPASLFEAHPDLPAV